MPSSIEELTNLLRHRKVLVLTGAGCSTESGIPDYRGPETRHKVRKPMLHRTFLKSAEARSRYWSRSYIGWPKFRQAQPNPAHRTLAQMEDAGQVTTIVTQNVDRLHHLAGSKSVVELHGALAEVRCLECALLEPRDELQQRLTELNADFQVSPLALAPDGDVDLPDEAAFHVADCIRCDGVLMPNVVFFGGTVPRRTVDRAFDAVHESEALLVVGSSLTVYSGFRFVRRAAEEGKPICLLNLGETRADDLATVHVHQAAGVALPRIAAALGTPP